MEKAPGSGFVHRGGGVGMGDEQRELIVKQRIFHSFYLVADHRRQKPDDRFKKNYHGTTRNITG
jgi:hypothetical protein